MGLVKKAQCMRQAGQVGRIGLRQALRDGGRTLQAKARE